MLSIPNNLLVSICSVWRLGQGLGQTAVHQCLQKKLYSFLTSYDDQALFTLRYKDHSCGENYSKIFGKIQ